jgi:hypothetical protein
MTNRTAFIISSYAVLAYLAVTILYVVFNISTIDSGEEIYFFIFYGLISFIISLFIAFFSSGLLGVFGKKESVSIWILGGIFITGIACSIYFAYTQRQFIQYFHVFISKF